MNAPIPQVLASATQSIERDLARLQTAPLAAETLTDEGQQNWPQQLNRLASLHPFEFDQVCKFEAKRLGVQVSTLREEVKRVRAAKTQDHKERGFRFACVEPWPQPVATDALLEELTGCIRRFMVCDEDVILTAALWVAMSWQIEVITVCPLLIITAPEKRCGKSQLLAVLGRLVRQPLPASNISGAALFRVVEQYRPTLLLDEVDTYLREKEELKGILNSGHTLDQAFVLRVEGEEREPRQFSTWCPKVLCGINAHTQGNTLTDRAHVLRLKRKLKHETVARLRHAPADYFAVLQRKLARWAMDHAKRIQEARPGLPEALSDREQDNWEPLLAIASLAGRAWIEKATQAALRGHEAKHEPEDRGPALLRDVAQVFEQRRVERIASKDLIRALCEDEEAPWSTYNKGFSISPKQVARLLGSYGIHSKDLRLGYGVQKGYERGQFEDAWARFIEIPASPPEIAATRDK